MQTAIPNNPKQNQNKRGLLMIKKITAALLVLTMIFTLASCAFLKKEPAETPSPAVPVISETVVTGDKKVAILLPAGTQFNEASLAAKHIQAAYSSNVIIKEYDNSYALSENKNNIIAVAEQAANDASVGAVVFAKATRLTSEAITAAKAINPDLKIICIEPEDSAEKIASKSDLVLCVDWVSAATDIVACAKAQGAEYFVMTSFNRHTSGQGSDNNSMLAATIKTAVTNECQKQEIKFIHLNTPDPISSGGKTAVIKEIRDTLKRYDEDGTLSGENVAIFSTDYHIQDELIKIVNEKKYIYISPSFPSAYNGIGDYYEVTMPQNPYETANFKTIAASAATGNAKLGYYNYSLETVLLTGAVHTAFDMLAGKTTSENLSERVNLRLNDASANSKFATKNFGGITNIFASYCPAFEKLK